MVTVRVDHVLLLLVLRLEERSLLLDVLIELHRLLEQLHGVHAALLAACHLAAAHLVRRSVLLLLLLPTWSIPRRLWLGRRGRLAGHQRRLIRLQAHQLLLGVVVLPMAVVVAVGVGLLLHQRGVGLGVRGIRLGQGVRRVGQHRLHVIEHEHIQILLQLLVRLCLRHHAGLDRDGLAGVGDVVLVEDVLGLIQDRARLRTDTTRIVVISRRLRAAHIEPAQTSIIIGGLVCIGGVRRLGRVRLEEIQIKRLRLLQALLLLVLLHGVETAVGRRVRCQAAQVQGARTVGDAEVLARGLVQINVRAGVVQGQFRLAPIHLLVVQRGEAADGGDVAGVDRQLGRDVVVARCVLTQVLL